MSTRSRTALAGLVLVGGWLGAAAVLSLPRGGRAAESDSQYADPHEDEMVDEAQKAQEADVPVATVKTPSSSRGMPKTPPPAVKKEDLLKLDKKLDQILQNQQTILQKFDVIMDELRIIKVRATLRNSS